MREQISQVICLVLLITVGAELFCLIVSGTILFCGGSLFAKFVGTMVCSFAMGSGIAVFTLLSVVGRLSGLSAILLSATGAALVGIVCGLICSRTDMTYQYFGGPEYVALFIWASVIPAVIGGILYGWLLFSDRGRQLLGKAGV